LVLCGALAAMAATLSASPPDSHLGQKVADHVVLVSQFTETPQQCSFPVKIELLRLLASGTLTKFEIPAGRALVVTDVDWLAQRPDGSQTFSPGTSVSASIRLEAGPQTSWAAFRSRSIPITEETKRALPGASEQLTTGFVVGPGVVICPLAQHLDVSGGGGANLLELILRGYLIDMPTRKSP